MKTIVVQFPKKEETTSYTLRLPLPLLAEARKIAKENKISLAKVIVTGLRLVVENKKELSPK